MGQLQMCKYKNCHILAFLCFAELRLKKKHKPFYMVQQWDDLCSKYTDAKAEDISNGELQD